VLALSNAEVKHLNNTIKGDPSLRSGWQDRNTGFDEFGIRP